VVGFVRCRFENRWHHAQACIRVRRLLLQSSTLRCTRTLVSVVHQGGTRRRPIITNRAVVTCSPGTDRVASFRRRNNSVQDASLHTLLRKCFVALGEEDARKAIDQQSADLVQSSAHVEWSLSLKRAVAFAARFQLIDTMACLERQSGPPMLAMVDSLERPPETHFKCIWG
jgi:hypothetical protein